VRRAAQAEGARGAALGELREEQRGERDGERGGERDGRDARRPDREQRLVGQPVDRAVGRTRRPNA
jgi:hypothetical protein